MTRNQSLLFVLSFALSLILALIWLLESTSAAYAANHTVGGACGSTIQACIDSASPGDTIIIPAGRYTESLTLSKAVSLTGVNSATTIIHALPNQRVLQVSGSAVDSSVVISGFTVTGGNLSASGGSGILLAEGAAPKLSNLLITRNHTSSFGGGLCVTANPDCAWGYPLETTLHLTHVDFISNTGSSGGGAYIDAALIMTGGLFLNNTSYYGGGGLQVNRYNSLTGQYLEPGVRIQATRFVSNTGGTQGSGGGAYIRGAASISKAHFEYNDSGSGGGGLSVSGPALLVEESRFAYNRISAYGGGGGLSTDSATVTIRNSRFLGNDATNCEVHCGAGYGGGVYSYYPTVIADSLFENNRGHEGGGLYVATSVTLSRTDFIGNQNLNNNGGAVTAVNAATINGGQFAGNQSAGAGGAIYTGLNGTMIISDAHFLRNQAKSYGGAISTWGVITATGSIFEGNHSDDSGGALTGSSLTMTNSQMLSNTAGLYGGGAYINGMIAIAGSQFQGNRAGLSSEVFGDGGGLYAGGGFISDTSFIDNHTMGNGAGALLYSGYQTITITNGIFRGNRADKSGGGLYSFGYGNLILINTQVDGNQAKENGGGIFISPGAANVTMQHMVVSGNQAHKDGGGVHGSTPLLMEDSDFIGNRAGDNGGGYYSYNGFFGHPHGPPYKILNSRFEGNVATAGWGGGLYALGWETYETRQISNTLFIDNRAGDKGGGASLEKSVITNSQFEGNHSDGDGGGLSLYASKSTSWLSDTLFFNNSAADAGGGMLVSFGSHVLSGIQSIANRARRGGGLAYLGSIYIGTHLNLENALFARNTVTETGAALYIGDGYHDLRHLTLADNVLNSKPALYFEPVCWVFGCTSLTLHNSIIANHAVGIHAASPNSGGDYPPTFDIDYNLYAGNSKIISATNVAPGPHDLRGDANFVNPAADDYRLGPVSDARDRASAAHCPAIDLEGNLRPQGAACDIGAYEGAPTTPALALTPTTFTFVAMQGVGQPDAQPLHIQNIAVGSLQWTASSNQSWLGVFPASGSGNQATVDIRVNQTGLAPGTYTGTVSVSGNASNSPQTAAVALTVLDGCKAVVANGDFEAGNSGWQATTNQSDALIRQASEMSAYATPHGGSRAVVLGWADGQTSDLSQEIKLPSGAPLALTYFYQIQTAESGCAEDKVEVRLGNQVIAEHALCQANNTNGWVYKSIDLNAYANHSAPLTFHLENGALGFPSVFLLDDVRIPIASNASCGGAPTLAVTPASLSFAVTEGGTTSPQAISIANSGTGALNWAASENIPWLSLNATSGAAPASVQATVNASGLSPGSYTGQITFASGQAQNSPQVINITLQVNPTANAPVLQVSPASLSFTANNGETPQAQSLAIANGGTGTLTWTAIENIAWLSLNATSGTGTAALEVAVNPSGLGNGTHSGQIIINAPGAADSPRIINVSLQVSGGAGNGQTQIYLPTVTR